MDSISSDAADATQRHPLVCRHPESGKVGVFSCLGYIAAIEGLDPDESRDLLLELYRWQAVRSSGIATAGRRARC
jgi:taurine dioxygenase